MKRSACLGVEDRMAEGVFQIRIKQYFKPVAHRVDGFQMTVFDLRRHYEKRSGREGDGRQAVEFIGVFAPQAADDGGFFMAVPERILGGFRGKMAYSANPSAR